MDLARYNKIGKLPNDFKFNGIKVHFPILDDSDYKRGYITRYFAQKANDTNSVVYEINDSMYAYLGNNSFYTIVKLNWKVSGDVSEIKEANFKSVKRASKVIPAIQLYLPYFLQFSKQ
jgi:hypothetical protein